MSTEMRPEQGIAGKFVRSALDENGVLSKDRVHQQREL